MFPCFHANRELEARLEEDAHYFGKDLFWHKGSATVPRKQSKNTQNEGVSQSHPPEEALASCWQVLLPWPAAPKYK